MFHELYVDPMVQLSHLEDLRNACELIQQVQIEQENMIEIIQAREDNLKNKVCYLVRILENHDISC